MLDLADRHRHLALLGVVRALDVDDDPYELDEVSAAIVDALDALDETRARKPLRIPEGFEGGGRFRSVSDVVFQALKDWAEGKGPDNPFDGLKDTLDSDPAKRREQLRRAAKARGLTLRRGATENEIANALLDDVRKGKAGKGDAHDVPDAKPEPKAVKKAAPRKAPAEKAAPTGVASYDRHVADAASVFEPDRAREVEVENRIRAAYRDLVAEREDLPGNDWQRMQRRGGDQVSIADLRDRLAEENIRGYEFDAALQRMTTGDGDGNAYPESKQSALTSRDRSGAFRQGDQDKHWLHLDDPSDRPVPGKAVTPDLEQSARDRPSGLPAKPSPQDYDDLAERLSRVKGATHAEREEKVYAQIADLNAGELDQLARRFGGESSGDQRQTRLRFPPGLSVDERRRFLARQMSEQRGTAGHSRRPTAAEMELEREFQQRQAEEGARDRQSAIDSARRYADVASKFDETVANFEGSDVDDFARLRRQVDQIAQRHGIEGDLDPVTEALDAHDLPAAQRELDRLLAREGLTRDSAAGASSRMDPKVHQPISGSIRQGAPVQVVRPGFTLTRDGERVRLSKAVVEEVDEPAAPTTRVAGIAATDEDQLRQLESTGGWNPAGGNRSLPGVAKRIDKRIVEMEALRQQGLVDRRPSGEYVVSSRGRAALVAAREARDVTEAERLGVRVQPRVGHDVTSREGLARRLLDEVRADPDFNHHLDGEDTSTGDVFSTRLAIETGYAGPPDLVDAAEFDAMVRRGEIGVTLYRGVQVGQYGKSPGEIHREYRIGPWRVGLGTFGNGAYMAASRRHASAYGDGTRESVGRYGLRSDARIIDWDDLDREHAAYWDSLPEDSPERDLYGDPGRFAMARGYDAIFIPKGTSPPFGTDAQGDQYVVLNRTTVVAEVPRGSRALSSPRRRTRPPSGDTGRAPGRAGGGGISGDVGSAAAPRSGAGRGDRGTGATGLADPLSDLRTLDPEATRDALDLKKVRDLQDLIREVNARDGARLPTSGRKRDLVDRLVGHLHGGGEASDRQARVDTMAARLHEDWRQSFHRTFRADPANAGKQPTRLKTTKDQAWIAAHGTDQVDIANTDYADLPEDWQRENAAAAAVIEGILTRRGGSVDLNDEATRLAVGEEIHAAWLDRNDWARGGDLDVPFADLPKVEQDKDIDQLRVAMGATRPQSASPAKAVAKWRSRTAAGITTHTTRLGHVTEFLPSGTRDRSTYRAYRYRGDLEGGAADFEDLDSAKAWVESWDGKTPGRAIYGPPPDAAPPSLGLPPDQNEARINLARVESARTIADMRTLAREYGIRIPSSKSTKADIRAHVRMALILREDRIQQLEAAGMSRKEAEAQVKRENDLRSLDPDQRDRVLAMGRVRLEDELRAAGHDVTPGHDELHHYWTRGEGLAKWAKSAHPWTTLVAHLTRHVGPEKAKVFASRWFHEVFGFYAGSDLNRVTHGRPPRGHRVGPG